MSWDSRKKSSRKFAANNSGNVLILSAFFIPLGLFAIGGGIEYSQLHSNRMNLERAADAAVLASVSKIRASAATTKARDISTQLKTVAEDVFDVEANILGDDATVEYSASGNYDDQVIDVALSYTYQQPTVFLKLFGFSSLTTSGRAASASSLGSYTEFNVFLDNSNSMGVGASQVDIDYMLANPVDNKGSCAFACHTNINKFKNKPVTLRIDAAKMAIVDAMDAVKNSVHPDSSVKFGVYSFDNEIVEIVDPDSNKADDINFIKNKIDKKITLRDGRHSRQDHLINEMASIVGVSGRGIEPDEPKKYALIITDGVQFLSNQFSEFNRLAPGGEWFGTERAQVMDSAACDALKAQGVEVYLVYTTYYPTNSSNPDLNRLSREIGDNILPLSKDRMKACASSPDNFFEAADASILVETISDVFKQVAIPTHVAF